MVKAFNEILRDFETDGVPSSGVHEPIKADLREALTAVQSFSNASGAALVFQTRSALYAVLTYAANTMAWVVSDTTAAYNGIYQKSGASGSGSWARVADLPYSFIVATNTGAGTANAIQATTAIPVSSTSLVILPIATNTTSSPVTVSFNSGSALTIKTVSGNNASALTAGMWCLGVSNGGNFRLLNDQNIASLVAQAEDARDDAAASAAEAETILNAVDGIASAVLDPTFGNLSAAAAFSPDVAPDYIRTAGYTTAGDKGGALYKKVASEPSHAGKFSITLSDSVTVVWYELAESVVTPQMFGAVADNTGVAGTGTDCRQAFLDFWSFCAKPATRCAGFVPAGYYRIASQMVWDLGLASPGTSPALLPQIGGGGEGVTTLVFDNNVTSPAFHIVALTGYVAAGSQRATFYGGIQNIGVRARVDHGVALQFGDDGTTYFNGFHCGPLVVSNPAPTTDSIAVYATGMISSELNTTANAGGVPASHGGNAADFYGTALKVSNCNMSKFKGAYGNAKTLLHLTGTGSLYGNTWYNVDFEVCETAVKQDNPNAGGTGNNLITGGTMTLGEWAFDVTAGQCLVAEGMLIGDFRQSIIKNVDSDVHGTYGGESLIIRRENRSIIGQVRSGSYWDSNVTYPPSSGSAAPVQPTLTRGTWIRNRWGQDAVIYIFSNNDANLEVYRRDWFDYSSTTGARIVAGAVATVMVQLKAGEWIRIPTSTATATWRWEAQQ